MTVGTRDETTWRAMLTARVRRNVAARVESRGAGRTDVYVRRRKPWYLFPPLSWIVPVADEQAVILDALGTYVWSLCVDSRTVEEIVEIFAERYRLTFHEARSAVTNYLRSLVQRGVLVLVIPEEKTA